MGAMRISFFVGMRFAKVLGVKHDALVGMN